MSFPASSRVLRILLRATDEEQEPILFSGGIFIVVNRIIGSQLFSMRLESPWSLPFLALLSKSTASLSLEDNPTSPAAIVNVPCFSFL